MDFSDPIGKPASGNRARVPPSNGFILQTFWDLLEIELKPKGNKLLSIMELWTCSKQSDKPLNEWLTSIYNLVEVCDYQEDSKDRIIRDALIIGCSCRGITRIHRSPSRPRPAVRPTAVLINIHEHLI